MRAARERHRVPPAARYGAVVMTARNGGEDVPVSASPDASSGRFASLGDSAPSNDQSMLLAGPHDYAGPVMPVGQAIETIAIVGSPTALGGHFAGMDRGPEALRAAGLVDRLRAAPGLAGARFVDHGDAAIEAGWAAD